MESLLNVNLHLSACLGKASNSHYKYSGSFLWPKNSEVCAEFALGPKFQFFPMENLLFPIH